MKTILLPFQDDDVAQITLQTAHHIAERFQGHIEGLFVLPQPQIIAGEGIALPGVYLTQMAEDGRKLADAAKARFDSYLSQAGIINQALEEPATAVTASWREIEGLESQIIGDHGRLFDLVVLGRTTKYYAGDWNIICEAALFESGRPALIAGNEAPTSVAKNVVIAWNGSTETARTVALGMPLIAGAEKVSVVTPENVSVPGPSADELASHLRRRGLEVTTEVLDAPNAEAAGAAIVEYAVKVEADLLVKGAYTHTRLRQMIFGGMTRHILTHAPMPVLMAH
jgi:nucleotide-binding universal stress UspA family protein